MGETRLEILGQLTKETYEDIKAGGGSEWPLQSDFMCTQAGFLSGSELLIPLYQEFGMDPFLTRVETLEGYTKVQPERFASEFLSDRLRER